MKKFCNKLVNKRGAIMSANNLGGNGSAPNSQGENRRAKTVSGCYDLEAARRNDGYFCENFRKSSGDEDVPEISFSFFGEQQVYQVVNPRPHEETPQPKHISKIEIKLASPDGLGKPQKSGSDPNISTEDSLYKVPGEVRRCRFSLSLDDLSVSSDDTKTPPKKTTWSNWKDKLSLAVVEQAAKQRVGAFPERPSLEEVYKNSREKCRRALKIFQARKEQQGSKKELTPSDIVYLSDSVSQPSVFGLNAASEVSTQKGGSRGSRYMGLEVPNGFEDLRKYIKQGGDFCKELAGILQERSDTELAYAKSLSKLSAKLTRACRENLGGLNDAWRSIAGELEARADAHRSLGAALLEETVKPLRNLTENQHKIRKQVEGAVDKTAKGLNEWRLAEIKGKKHSHSCSRDNEKLQDAMLDARLSKSNTSSLIQLAHTHNKVLSEKENTKLETKRRKAEEAVKKADVEYYTLCVRAERARLEWESSALKGANTFQTLESERLGNLKATLNSYVQHNKQLGPKIIEATDTLSVPVSQADPAKDLTTFVTLRNTTQQASEQLLPDFYCEHITLAMNRERRKQALVKLLQLIRQDLERESKSRNGLENLSRAMRETPSFGGEDSQQNVHEKLFHMKSMLTYLEAAKYKVQNALAELDSRPRTGHPLGPHITVTRDKSGLQHSILKVPQWLREDWIEDPPSEKQEEIEPPDWSDRGAADGNSIQPDSDFDEFSSQSSLGAREDNPVHPIAQCKAIYAYVPNLPDELALQPGDVLSVYRKQEDGWWLGECRGSVGIFPATYVEVL